jgi:multiple sugar transport system substrate-binding protein
LAETFGRKWKTNHWIAIPMGGAGGPCNYRISWVKQAGFDKIPNDLDQFLTLCRKLKEQGHPAGFALGNAVGDANGYANWLLWSHNAYITEEDGTIAINRPQTIEALKYAKALQETLIPGTLSWLDPSNNKVFLDGQISVTNNGISIYYAAKTSKDPKINALAADINHSVYPTGPAGTNAAFHLFLNQMIFKYTKYPKAAKEFLRFMMEEEQFGPWMQASIGYVAHPLVAYEKNPIWTVDPKHLPYRDAVKELRPAGYDGKLGYASAGVLADFVMVDMVAAAASGQKSPKEAAQEAQKRAERYYKV